MFGQEVHPPTPFGLRRFRERLEAQKAWPCLTQQDLSSISSEAELRSVISAHTGRSQADLALPVSTWMKGHFRRLAAQAEPASMGTHAPLRVEQ
jgi:hypothetical protein